MYKKIAFAGLGIALLASPLLVSADTLSDLQAQIQALLAQIATLQAQVNGSTPSTNPPPANTTSCINVSASMGPDDTDANTNGDVTRLQQFLGGRVTGYFGPATLQLVQRWQAAHSLVSSGDPDTTGYGYVGPKTRAAMAQGCLSGIEPWNPTTPPIQINDPVISANFTASPISGAAPLIVTFSARLPISGVDSGITYSVDLGDGSAADVRDGGGVLSNFSHTYASAGTYTAKLMRTSNPCVKLVNCYAPVSMETIGTARITVGGSTNTPSITVTYPQAGYSLYNGLAKGDGTPPTNPIATIKWTSSGLGNDTIGIALFYASGPQNGQLVKYLAQGGANTGSYVWLYDPTLQSGTYLIDVYDYRIGLTKAGTADGSSGPFQVVTDTNTNSQVSFTASPTSGAAPLQVTFNVTGITPVNSNYSVDFSDLDGSNGILEKNLCNGSVCYSATHTYIHAGTYRAKLLQVGPCGNAGQTCWNTVTSVPPVEITVIGSVAPQVTNVQPNHGSYGTMVTVSGIGFSVQGNPLIDLVQNGTVMCSMGVPTLSSISPTAIQFTISGTFAANCASGQYQLRYVNGSQFSNGVSFTLDAAQSPAVRVISPNVGGTYTIGTNAGTGDFLSYEARGSGIQTDGTFSIYLTQRNDSSWMSGVYRFLNASSGWQVGQPQVMQGSSQLASSYTPGAYYLLAVWQGLDGTYLSDFSDQPVTLVSPGTTQQPTLNATPTSGTAPLAVQFVLAYLNQGSSPGPYALNFGDASAAYITNTVGKDGTTHTYTSAGTYTATLTRSGLPLCYGCTAPVLASVTITVGGGTTQQPTLSVAPTSGGSPLRVDVSFTLASPCNTYTLDWGNGGSQGGGGQYGCSNWTAYTIYTLSSPGTQTYTITLRDRTTGQSTSKQVTVTPAPAPTFTFNSPTSASSLTAGQPASIVWSASAPAGKVLSAYKVSFAYGQNGVWMGGIDAGWSLLNAASAQWNVPSGLSGTYQLKATVIEEGPSGAPIVLEQVSNPFSITQASTASPSTFTAWPNSGAAPLNVYFTVTGMSSAPTFSVNFGDGASGSHWTPDETAGIYFMSHSYAVAGTYTASAGGLSAPVTVSGGNGEGATYNGTVSSSGTNPNVASALSALQSALQAMLAQLGH